MYGSKLIVFNYNYTICNGVIVTLILNDRWKLKCFMSVQFGDIIFLTIIRKQSVVHFYHHAELLFMFQNEPCRCVSYFSTEQFQECQF